MKHKVQLIIQQAQVRTLYTKAIQIFFFLSLSLQRLAISFVTYRVTVIRITFCNSILSLLFHCK